MPSLHLRAVLRNSNNHYATAPTFWMICYLRLWYLVAQPKRKPCWRGFIAECCAPYGAMRTDAIEESKDCVMWSSNTCSLLSDRLTDWLTDYTKTSPSWAVKCTSTTQKFLAFYINQRQITVVTNIPDPCPYPELTESNPCLPILFFCNQLKYNFPIYA
jgi:hypothetical protein